MLDGTQNQRLLRNPMTALVSLTAKIQVLGADLGVQRQTRFFMLHVF